jgi:hypothetical protein
VTCYKMFNKEHFKEWKFSFFANAFDQKSALLDFSEDVSYHRIRK